jgi:ankyrin repeat protein
MQQIAKWCCGIIAIVMLTGASYAQDIHEAVASGDIDKVRALITADTSLINMADDRGMTPLRMAIYTLNTEIVQLLLEHGAKTDDSHPMFGTVMSQAIANTCQKNGSPDLIEILIDHGLAFDAGAIDRLGMSPLDWAVHFGNVPMVRIALEHGADVNLVSPRMGRPPLVAVVSSGNEELVTMFLDRGADVTIVDKHGCPSVFYAVSKGRTHILKQLLDHGASVHFTEPHYGRSLLHLVAINGFHDIAELLVTRGGNVNAADDSGKTPIYYAAIYGNRNVADFLVNHEAVMPPDRKGNDDNPSRLTDDLDQSEAAVWYLNHRGWAIKTDSRFLIFDAEEFDVRRSDNPSLANGFLTPGELEQQNVVGLYSCYHGQPGEPAYIHTLADSLEHISYIHLVDDAWRGSPNTTYLKGMSDTAAAQVAVQTIDIADYMPALAYLCHVDGLTIYYQAFGTDNPGKYRESLEFLAQFTDTVDIAFLPLPDLEQEENDVRLFLDRFPTRSLLLLDPGRRVYLFPEAARQIADWGYKTAVYCADNPGDRFTYPPLE